VVAVVCDNVIIHHAKLVQRWLATHPRVVGVARGPLQPHDNPVERIWAALKAWLANSPTSTIQGRLRQVHAFFRQRSPAQLLATAAPSSSPWLPEGYIQNFPEAALEERASAPARSLTGPAALAPKTHPRRRCGRYRRISSGQSRLEAGSSPRRHRMSPPRFTLDQVTAVQAVDPWARYYEPSRPGASDDFIELSPRYGGGYLPNPARARELVRGNPNRPPGRRSPSSEGISDDRHGVGRDACPP
jgi:hypothetical protein